AAASSAARSRRRVRAAPASGGGVAVAAGVLMVEDVLGAVALLVRAFAAIAEVELRVGEVGLAADAAAVPRGAGGRRGRAHLAADLPGAQSGALPDVPAEEEEHVADRGHHLQARRPRAEDDFDAEVQPGDQGQPADLHRDDDEV